MSNQLYNKVAIITGGASGIGEGIVRKFVEEGAKVIVADFNIDQASSLANELGENALAFQIDVTDLNKVKEMVDFTIEKFGKLDIAVNNAGISGKAAIAGDVEITDWQRVIEVNLNSVFYCMKEEIPHMLKNGGSIINMASMLGTVGFETASAYVAAKHGVVGLTKVAGAEYAAQGVRINAICPGFIETPLVKDSLSSEAYEGLKGLHPIGRLGQPVEVANLAVFLASDNSSFINGSHYIIDGGYTTK
ncbi:SDR family NAD(P)-dependent oxidoreductase [Halobacteriovorax sp. GFR7]|uniref:SDR family NAD(P)-dependent oxidoreductase n=1 Tax=unclassified Halobacteriovorax TaxID=2639665 RepID=UPI003D991A30